MSGEGKNCTVCKEFKAFKHFHKRKHSRDGLRSSCKDCTNEQCRRYRENNKDKVRITNKRYRENNSEKIAESDREYRINNREKIANKSKEYQERNRDRLVAYRRDYYWKNRDTLLEKVRLIEKAHPVKKAIREQRRRARIAALPHTFTEKEWDECLKYFENKCCYCGQEGKMEQDHFIPLTKGGGYVKDNIVPSCASCNSSKHNKDFHEWYKGHKNYCKDMLLKIEVYLGQCGQEVI